MVREGDAAIPSGASRFQVHRKECGDLQKEVMIVDNTPMGKYLQRLQEQRGGALSSDVLQTVSLAPPPRKAPGADNANQSASVFQGVSILHLNSDDDLDALLFSEDALLSRDDIARITLCCSGANGCRVCVDFPRGILMR